MAIIEIYCIEDHSFLIFVVKMRSYVSSNSSNFFTFCFDELGSRVSLCVMFFGDCVL